MAVIRDPVTVDGDTDLDPVLGEQLAEILIEQDAVRMDPQVEAAYPTQRRMKLRDNPLQPATAASRGSPPCSTTCTMPSPCAAAYSAMRRAVREITSSEMALGRARQP